MTEILTESFCERCGTRYTFESARPRTRLKGVKVLSRGLKNFVLSDETSMDEAMAAARSETDRESTAYQLDAFHKTFNFCMQCRQYTCPNCWNEAEVRCLTCAPHLGHEVLPAPFPDLPAAGTFIAEPIATETSNGANGSNGRHADPYAADADEGFDFAARLAALTSPAQTAMPDAPVEAVVPIDEPVVADASVDVAPEPEPALEAVAEASVAEPAAIDLLPILAAQTEPAIEEPVAPLIVETPVVREPPVVASEPEPAIDSDEVDHQAAARLAALGAAAIVADAVTPESDPDRSIGDKITGQTTGLLKRFRPIESLDSELDAYEREQVARTAAAAELAAAATATPPAEPEPIVAAEPVPAPTPTFVPEPVSPVEPEIAAAAAPTPPATQDIVPQPTWQMVAPDPAAEDASQPPATQPAAANGATPSAEPQWPDRPQWLGGGPSNGLPFLNRPATPQGGLEALWAQSNAEVVNPAGPAKAAGGIQPCVSCGLSLSATAKFCRRCGTPQAG